MNLSSFCDRDYKYLDEYSLHYLVVSLVLILTFIKNKPRFAIVGVRIKEINKHMASHM